MNSRLLIAGGGVAGLTAALYAARAGVEPMVLEGGQPGGQLMTAATVESYPGFTGLGPDLMTAMRTQAAQAGAAFLDGEVSRAALDDQPFAVISDGGAEISCDALIVATGAAPRRLGVPGEDDLLGYGVSTCATCDGFFYKDREVAVVGGGDAAVDEAIYLAGICSKVTVIHRRAPRAHAALLARARAQPRIEWVNGEVARVAGSRADGVTGVVLADSSRIAAAALFVAVGRIPDTRAFAGQLERDGGGYLTLRGRGTATSVDGVFAAGEVADPIYRQAVTAAGSGCMAALDALAWLRRRS